jgi:cell wall-associated NlpC family hydrolase
VDRDYIIRILIEGKDRFSSALQGAVAKTRTEVDKLKASYAGAGAEGNALDTQWQKMAGSGRGLVGVVKDLGRETSSARGHVRGLLNDVRDGERDLNRVERAFASLGRGIQAVLPSMQQFGSALAKGIEALPTAGLGIVALGSAITLLLPLLVGLGAALTAVASATAVAAAGLAGGLLAGLAQLVPIAGLAIAVFERLKLVFAAVGLQEKAQQSASKDAATAANDHRQKVEALSNALWSLRQAHIAVGLAQQHIIDSEKRLAQARLEATRRLVDDRNQQVDAVLSVRDAELSLLEAQQKLREDEKLSIQQQQEVANIRQQRKNQAEALQQLIARGAPADQIAAAQEHLAELTSNLSSAQTTAATGASQLQVARDKLSVDQAEQRLKESRIQSFRATQDLNKAEKLGIERSPEVVQAKRDEVAATQALINARHDVMVQERGVADAERSLKTASTTATGATQALNTALKELSPSEKNLVGVITRLKDVWEKVTRPITDGIVNAIARGLDKVTQMLQDPKIVSAFTKLGKAFGAAIDSLSSFFTGPAGRKFIEFFTGQATKNLPIFVRLFENLLKFLGDIAKAAAPIFTDLLKSATSGIAGWDKSFNAPAATGKSPLTRRTGAPSTVTRGDVFFQNAEIAMKTFFRFTGAFLRLLGAIIAAGDKPGLGAFDSLISTLNRWTAWIRSHPKEVNEFFSNGITITGKFLVLAGKLVGLFAKLSDNQGFSNFIDALGNLAVSVASDVFNALAIFLDAIAKLAAVPGVGQSMRAIADAFIILALVPKSVKGLGANLIRKGFDVATGKGGALNQTVANMEVGTLIAKTLIAGTEVGGSNVVKSAEKGSPGLLSRFRGAAPVGGGIAGGTAAEAGGVAATEGTIATVGAGLAPETLGISAAIAAALIAMIALAKWTGHLGELWKGLKQIVSSAIDGAFIRPFHIIKDLWEGKWGKLWKDIKREFMDLFVTPFKGTWNILKGMVLTIWDTIKKGADKLWPLILSGFESLGHDIQNLITSNFAWKYILSLGETIWGGFKTAYLSTKKFLTQDLPAFAKNVGGMMANVMATVANWLAWPINKMIDAWDWVVDKLGTVGVPGMSKLHIPDIPKASAPGHAAGGVIGYKPGGVYRVAEEYDEAVIPLDPGRRQSAMEIMRQALSRMGKSAWQGDMIPSFAAGGIATAKGIIQAALSQLGVPYVWGAESPGKGMDCSGLMQYAYSKMGIRIPRTTYDQWPAVKHVSQLQPADLVFSEFGSSGPGHVRMYMGGGRVVAAPHTGTVVQIQSLGDRQGQSGGRVLGNLGSHDAGIVGNAIGAGGHALGKAKDFITGILGLGINKVVPDAKGAGALINPILKTLGHYIWSLVSKLPHSAWDILKKLPGIGPILGGLGSIGGSILHGAGSAISGIANFFAGGGDVPGKSGHPVPIIAHAGEWILNAGQQTALAVRAFGGSVNRTRDFLFGGAGAGVAGAGRSVGHAITATVKMPKGPRRKGDDGHVYAIDQDEFGNYVTFVQLKNGTWGQVGVGTQHPYMPDKLPSWLARRSYYRSPAQRAYDAFLKSGDYTMANLLRTRYHLHPSYLDPGGQFAPGTAGIQSLAEGGIVRAAVTNRSAPLPGKTISQHFSIHTTQAEPDMDYIMRMGQMHAEASY